MNLIATAHATDEDLRELGLTRKGDLISLRRFCVEKLKESENDERLHEKKDLLEKILERNKAKRKYQTSSGLPHPKRSKGAASGSGTKRVQLGWLHYDESKKRYIAVRQNKGGGTREIYLSPDATAERVIETGKELFFPDGVSSFGKTDTMEFTLANYKEEVLSTVVVAGAVLPFTIQRYMNATKLPRARLYLASKVKTSESEDEPEDSSLPQMIGLDTDATSRRHKPEQTGIGDPADHGQMEKSDEEYIHQTNIKATRELVAEQDKEYRESLLADQQKEEERRGKLLSEIREAEQQEQVRQTRLKRVPDEPKDGSSMVLIRVRHLTLGVITRYYYGVIRLSGKPYAVSWCMASGLLDTYQFACHHFSLPLACMERSPSRRQTSWLHSLTM